MNKSDRAPGKTDARTYVLIHGAWHGGWVWRDVVPALRAMGQTVFAPTLTGLGERKHLASDAVDLETHITDVLNMIEMEDLNHIHLVGWSYGGMVATGVLACVKDWIKSMIYLDAFVPENGKALIDYAEKPAREAFLKAKAEMMPIAPIPLKVFGVNDPAVVAYIEPRLVLHPWRCMIQPVKALAEHPKEIPHTYIRCEGFDPSPFTEFLTKFAKDPHWDTYVLKTSHVAMLTDPKGTTELLAKAK
jgi:pimeloyl-ACP methyl ester carboxylesterase